MLTYDLDKRGSTPLYDYLYQCIRQDIISGRLQAGERLPSKRTLAQHLSVGIITVANAYAQLAVEGYITSREKKGYFVENVSSYRVRRKAAAAMQPEAAEREYFADFDPIDARNAVRTQRRAAQNCSLQRRLRAAQGYC